MARSLLGQCILAVAFLLGMCLGQVHAETGPPQVGRIIGIDGGKFGRRAWITSADGKRRSAVLRVGDKICLGDIIEAGEDTSILFEASIGGQGKIMPNSSKQVISRDKFGPTGNRFQKLRANNEALWAKIDKQNEQLQIQTASGVIGVEG